MASKNKQLCECGHDKAFHDITDSGECIHGLILDPKKGIINNKKCNCKCFRTKGKIETLIFLLSEKNTANVSCFYYPNKSCKTNDGDIKHLISALNKLDNFEKDYNLDIRLRRRD